MEIDHIFICSKNNGIEANALLNFGLTEGSNRIHKGQGTTNRKFYFENFFLELLWVIDENEIQQTPIKETQLWERSRYHQNGVSRFGLCLVNTKETDKLFEKAQTYQPAYFPTGMSIDILPNTDNPHLPWTFRLPFRGGRKKGEEPIDHSNQIGKLTHVEFGVVELDVDLEYLRFFEQEETITFSQKDKSELILEFDYGKQQKIFEHKELDLIIKY